MRVQDAVAAVRAFARERQVRRLRGRTPRPNRSVPRSPPGPSSTSVRTAARSHSPSPAYSVSCSCSATSSSSLSATAMPPCAYSDDDSRRLSFATTSTWPASASSMAARRPATPAPITRKSGFIRYCDDSVVQIAYALFSRGNAAAGCYSAIVERGVIGQAARTRPAEGGQGVRRHHGGRLAASGRGARGGPGGRRRTKCSIFPAARSASGWRPSKRSPKRWCSRGGDRTSVVIAFGGGIVNDMAGFLAAIFMRGIPVIQIPTTLLAQVDAADRRQDRREPRQRQEPDRQLPSSRSPS